MTFSPPSDDDNTRIAKQWLNAVHMVKEYSGHELTFDVASLNLLQSALDSGTPKGEADLTCFGVALAMVMVENIPGLDWWIIDDEYGREPCLRYQTTSLALHPVAMIVKRVKRDEEVDIAHLYFTTAQRVSEISRSGNLS